MGEDVVQRDPADDSTKRKKQDNNKNNNNKSEKKQHEKETPVISSNDGKGSTALQDIIEGENAGNKSKKNNSSKKNDKTKKKSKKKDDVTSSRRASTSQIPTATMIHDEYGIPSSRERPTLVSSTKERSRQRRKSLNHVSEITKMGRMGDVKAVISEDEFQADEKKADSNKKKDKRRDKKKTNHHEHQNSSINTHNTDNTVSQSTKTTSVSMKEPCTKSKMKKSSPPSTSETRQEGLETKQPNTTLQKLLNIDPFSKSDYNENAIIAEITLDPVSCSHKYKFDAFGGPIYPFSMLCALGASTKLLQICFSAFPEAANEKDIWVGTPMHYATAYLGTVATVRFLMDISPESASSLNRLHRTPFHAICLFNPRSDILQTLVDLAPTGLRIADKDGNTALHVSL
jgi:hypothetical protein